MERKVSWPQCRPSFGVNLGKVISWNSLSVNAEKNVEISNFRVNIPCLLGTRHAFAASKLLAVFCCENFSSSQFSVVVSWPQRLRFL